MGWLINLVLTAAGLYMIALGAYFFMTKRREISGSVPVKLRVIALHEERNSDNDVVTVPEFEILDGPHTGARRRSKTGEPRPLHNVGDTFDGVFNAETGHIASNAELPFYKWMPVWSMVGGIVLFGLASFF